MGGDRAGSHRQHTLNKPDAFPGDPMRLAAAVEAPATEAEQNLSDTLKAARLLRQIAAALLESAVAACSRASQNTMNAQARRAALGDVAGRIARERAEMVKRDERGEVPDKLLNDWEQCTEVDEQIRQCADAEKLLEAERVAAEEQLDAVTQRLSVEAFNAMLVEASELADEVRAAYRRIFEICDSLLGLDVMLNAAAQNLPAPAVLQLRARLRQVLEVRHPPKPPYVPGIAAEHTRQAVAIWQGRHKELMG
jgi:hypothetical protein